MLTQRAPGRCANTTRRCDDDERTPLAALLRQRAGQHRRSQDHPVRSGRRRDRSLRDHPDRGDWLHSGDPGRRDADGFLCFTVRRKRMSKSCGCNVYPAQVEPVRAYVVLEDPAQAGHATARALSEFCPQNLINGSCPRAIELRTELPKARRQDRRQGARAGARGAARERLSAACGADEIATLPRSAVR
jgi:acyl-CoA synthetase (AMP-forming)/AMP-acid ligase II